MFWFSFPLFFAFSSSSQLFCCSYAKETTEKSFFLFCLFMQRCNTEIDWNCKLIWGRLNTLCFRVDVLLSSDRRLLLLLFLSLLLPIGFGSFFHFLIFGFVFEHTSLAAAAYYRRRRSTVVRKWCLLLKILQQKGMKNQQQWRQKNCLHGYRL